jgi:hypothetical protein
VVYFFHFRGIYRFLAEKSGGLTKDGVKPDRMWAFVLGFSNGKPPGKP